MQTVWRGIDDQRLPIKLVMRDIDPDPKPRSRSTLANTQILIQCGQPGERLEGCRHCKELSRSDLTSEFGSTS